jgi:hypothetical protein
MPKLRFLVVLTYLLLVPTSCTLPLIWEDSEEVTEPPVVVEISPTATDQPKQDSPDEPLLPTNTPLEPVVSPTPKPATPVREQETPLPTPSLTPTPVVLPYVLQQGSPVAVPNFSRPELGCNWLGVGGQVFDRRGQPKKSIIVEVGGSLAGIDINKIVVSGGAAVYGEGGYELTLAERPIGTDGTLWIQLYDIAGEPLSERYYFSTYNDCAQNLILINFNEVLAQPYGVWLPIIER